MTQAGTITLAAKVLDIDKARADLRGLGAEAQNAARLQAEAAQRAREAAEAQRRASDEARRATQAQTEAQRRAMTDSARIAEQIQDRMNRATMSGAEYRIHQAQREAEQIDAAIRKLAVSRKQQEELIFKNVAAMEAQITRITQEEAEKQARAHKEAQASSGTPGVKAPNGVGFAEVAAMAAKATAAIGTVSIALYAFGNAATFAVEQAALYESSMKTLEIVSQRTGGSFIANKKLVEEFSDAISSPAAAAQAVRVFQTMNLSLADQRKLISSIRDGIVAMGGDVNEQLPIMALAIKRGEGELLDNMGVVSTVEQMYKRFAAAIGTTADKLDDAQRAQAIINGVLRETATFAGTAERSTETYKGSVANLNAALRDFAKHEGDGALPTLRNLNNLLAEGIRRFGKLRQSSMEAASFGTAANYGLGNDGRPLEAYRAPAVPTPLIVSPEKADEARAQHVRRAKQAEEDAEKARQKARDDAAEAKKKADDAAKQAAQRAAADQKRLQEELHRELATTGKSGRDLELAQERLWYDERVKLAHGNAKLLEDLKLAHNQRLREIDKKHPPMVQSGINTTARALQFGMGQVASPPGPSTFDGTMGLGRLALGPERGFATKDPLDWSASGGKALPAAALEGIKPDWTDAIRQATESGLMGAIEATAKGDLGGLQGALQSVMAKSADPLVSALAGPAGLAITFGSMLISGIAGAAQRAKQEAEAIKQHIKDLEDRYGPPKTKQNQIIDDWNDDQKRRDLYQKKGALEKDVRDIEGQLKLTSLPESMREMLTRQLRNKTGELSGVNKDIGAIDAQYQSALNLTDAQERAATQANAMADAMERNAQVATMLESAQAGLAGAQIRNDLATGKIDQTTYDQRMAYATAEAGTQRVADDLIEMMLGGKTDRASAAAASISVESTLEALRSNPSLKFEDVGNQLGDRKMFDLLVTALQAEGLNKSTADADSKRALPGSSPQTPMYTVVTNVKDFRDAFPASTAYRAAGAGTTRRDGPPLGGRGTSGGRSV